MIAQIGEWVLLTACSDAVIWPVNVGVAVNLSPAQFRQAKISEIVLSALAQSRLPPERLELEITETALIKFAGRMPPGATPVQEPWHHNRTR